ncbi:hypothetical protein P4H67_25630 [Paenibacillus lautus]|uniref:DUF6978 family protein n=1 Tax=Paenibacillus lautus TaxID=1401 RepID=UPI002DBB3EFA|nr:hypothetical protein [Paenibacillus lautus]MEC0310139.1 hypothetical protein [Paenibacillus lautus]
MLLNQNEVNELLSMLKSLRNNNRVTFPTSGESIALEAESNSTNDKFLIDINRKGQITFRCTYQTRFKKSNILLRLDLQGPAHTNPDMTKIPVPHLHIWREGFEDRWAYPLGDHIDTDPENLVNVLIAFLEYNNFTEVPSIVEQHTLF